MQPPRPFGQRTVERKQPPQRRQQRRADRGEFTRWVGLDPIDADGDRMIVPTTLRGVALAAAGVFLLQFAILLARRMANGVAGTALDTDIATVGHALPAGVAMGMTYFVWTLAFSALHIGALYSLLGHAILRWLRMTSLLAYALGGFAAVYVFLAVWVFGGQHLQIRPTLIELAGGTLACWLFRYGSGLAPVAGSRPAGEPGASDFARRLSGEPG